MTTITIDLTKNPELAALVADKQPGEWIKLEASIKSRDDQTLVVRLENCDDCEKPDNADEDAADGGADDASEGDASSAAPAEKPAKKLADRLNSAGDSSMM